MGEDTGTRVSEDYHAPFKFTGTIHKVDTLLGDEKTSEAGQKAIEKAEADLGTSDRGQYFLECGHYQKLFDDSVAPAKEITGAGSAILRTA